MCTAVLLMNKINILTKINIWFKLDYISFEITCPENQNRDQNLINCRALGEGPRHSVAGLGWKRFHGGARHL